MSLLKKIRSCMVPAVLVGAFLPLTGYSQIKIVKEAGQENPKLLFKGVAGNPQLSALIASNLKDCGWFSMVTGGEADYQVAGNFQGSSVALNVTGAPSFAFSVPATTNLTEAANKAVDYMLKKIFNIPGICNSRIAFVVEPKKGYKEIMLCDFNGRNPEQITRNGSLSVEPDWTPGNRSLIYTMYKKGYTDIVEYDIKSRRSRRLAQYPGLNASGAVSPNGKILALILSRDDQIELYLKQIGSTALKRLTSGKAVEASPAWSPQGNQICFVSDMSGGRPKLFLISPSGGNAKQIATVGSEAVSPDWSSDNKIVYSARKGNQYVLAVTDLSGKGPSGEIACEGGDWESPSWAPDNRHVVCTRTTGGKAALYMVDTWTGKARLLLSGKYNCSLPSWSSLN